MGPEFWLFAAVGFAAQLVDGALGMAYGVVSTTVLLANGVPPATASASVHAAKVFTGAASAVSHIPIATSIGGCWCCSPPVACSAAWLAPTC